MSDLPAIKYRAFLSYSHRDTAWVKWLHAALESYRPDRDLVGRDTPVGPVPATLRPIFRDREDFTAGHSLTEQTLAALESSQFLVAVCSPNAAQSRYVNEEIRRFKSLGRSDRILPLIVAGEPGHPERECFPPALRFKLGADGNLSDDKEEPIAADARPEGDGKNLARLKLIAGLLGVGFDDIVRRAERARRRRNRIRSAVVGVVLIFGVVASASAAFAWQQLKTNETFLDRTLQRATEFVNLAVAQSEHYGVSRAATNKLLERAEALFDDMAELGRETPQLRYRKAWMLIEFARNYNVLGQTDKQRTRAAEAAELLASLSSQRPDDVTYRRDLSVAYNEVGNAQFSQGDLTGALRSFRAAMAIVEGLVAREPGNVVWQRDLSVAYDKIGDVAAGQGDLSAALVLFRKGLAIDLRLAENPDNAHARRDLSVSFGKIGELLLLDGKTDEALAMFRESLALRQRAAAAEPDNLGRQRDLAVAFGKIGDTLVRNASYVDALVPYRESLAIRVRLVAADPANTGWQRDLIVAHNKIGEVGAAQGNLAEALASFRAGLTIAERLAAIDPRNTGWRRDVAVAHSRIGEVLMTQGDLEGAVRSFGEGVEIAERLAQSDPANAPRQSDLALILRKLGAALLAQGKLPEALRAFNESVAADARAAKTDRPAAGAK